MTVCVQWSVTKSFNNCQCPSPGLLGQMQLLISWIESILHALQLKTTDFIINKRHWCPLHWSLYVKECPKWFYWENKFRGDWKEWSLSVLFFDNFLVASPRSFTFRNIILRSFVNRSFFILCSAGGSVQIVCELTSAKSSTPKCEQFVLFFPLLYRLVSFLLW